MAMKKKCKNCSGYEKGICVPRGLRTHREHCCDKYEAKEKK